MMRTERCMIVLCMDRVVCVCVKAFVTDVCREISLTVP